MKNRIIIQVLHANGYRCIRSCGAARQYRKANVALAVVIIGSDDDYTPLTVVAWITRKTGLALMSQA